MRIASKPLLIAGWLLLGGACAGAQNYLLRTDPSWRTIKGVVAVPADWNSAVSFDDSDAAGWTNSYEVPNTDRIWNTSNLSSESPANPRFRHVFALAGPVRSSVGNFYFDDDATVWINGTEVLNDTDGHAGSFTNVVLDSSLFNPGQNLIAVWGHNKVAPYNVIEAEVSLTLVAERPVLRVAQSGGRLRLTWDALAGVTYQLQYATTLPQAVWNDLGQPVTATNTVAVLSDSPADAARFYRLIVRP